MPRKCPIRYFVNGKPYISANKAIRNANSALPDRFSNLVLVGKNCVIKNRLIINIVMTKPQAP